MRALRGPRARAILARHRSRQKRGCARVKKSEDPAARPGRASASVVRYVPHCPTGEAQRTWLAVFALGHPEDLVRHIPTRRCGLQRAWRKRRSAVCRRTVRSCIHQCLPPLHSLPGRSQPTRQLTEVVNARLPRFLTKRLLVERELELRTDNLRRWTGQRREALPQPPKRRVKSVSRHQAALARAAGWNFRRGNSDAPLGLR